MRDSFIKPGAFLAALVFVLVLGASGLLSGVPSIAVSASDSIGLDTTPPKMTVTAPVRQTHIRRLLRMTVEATDTGGLPSGLKIVRLYRGAELVATATAGSIFRVDLTKIPDGKHRFTVKAADRAGNLSEWTRTYFVDNTKPRVKAAYFSPAVPAVGGTAPLYFKFGDFVSPEVSVRAEIKSLDGRVLSRTERRFVPRNTPRQALIRTPDFDGEYVYKLFVRDLAGNRRVYRRKFTAANRWDLQNVKNHLFNLTRNIGVRKAGTAGEAIAADYIDRKLRDLGYTVKRQEFSIPGNAVSRNVITEKAGADPSRRFILGAHFDSLPPSPGGNDNATGPSILLDVAKVLKGKRTKPTIVLVFFGAEEQVGPVPNSHHYGSRHYLANMTEEQKRQAIGMLSVDMVGYGPSFNLRFMERGPRSLVDNLAAFAGKHNYPLVYLKDGSRFGLSDHEPFETAGIPAAWLQWRADPALHTAGDTYFHVQWDRVNTTGTLITDYLGSEDSILNY